MPLKDSLGIMTVCVENQTIVANIVSKKSYPRNILMTFKFSNYHFYFQNCHFRALFCRFTANQGKIRKMTTDSMFTYPRVGWEMRIRIVHCYISLCLKDAHKNFKNKKNKNLKKKVADRCQNWLWKCFFTNFKLYLWNFTSVKKHFIGIFGIVVFAHFFWAKKFKKISKNFEIFLKFYLIFQKKFH